MRALTDLCDRSRRARIDTPLGLRAYAAVFRDEGACAFEMARDDLTSWLRLYRPLVSNAGAAYDTAVKRGTKLRRPS